MGVGEGGSGVGVGVVWGVGAVGAGGVGVGAVGVGAVGVGAVDIELQPVVLVTVPLVAHLNIPTPWSKYNYRLISQELYSQIKEEDVYKSKMALFS